MSLELSNEDLRTLIDLLADRRPFDFENLRVRLADELARREPGTTAEDPDFFDSPEEAT